MNVQKTNFISKQKKVQDRRPKIMGYHTRSNLMPAAKCFELPGFKASDIRNEFISSPRFSSITFRAEESVDEPKSPKAVSNDAMIIFNSDTNTESLHHFQVWPGKNLKDSNTSTSVEFQKLLEPFQNFRQENEDTTRDLFQETNYVRNSGRILPGLMVPEGVSSESIFENQKAPAFEKDKKNTQGPNSNGLVISSPWNRKPFDQYNIFNLHVPKNQKSMEEILNAKSTVSPAVLPTIPASPDVRKIRPTSTFHSRTPKNRSRKSPKTSGSSKTLHSDSGAFILAVTEGRGHARGEVGIAAMDPKRPHLILCQISDGQRYVHSLTKMNVFDFVEVIVPNTFVDGAAPSKLYGDIRSTFPKVTLTSVQRRHFNEAVGLDLIKQYCSLESTSVMVLLRDKFYALSASAALIKYVEFTQNVRLAPRSLKIEYQGTEDTMIIDLETANLLELVMCVSHPEVNLNHSLLGVVKHCHTKGGIRLLRANILQPPCSLVKIESRLDCVEELVANPVLLCGLEGAVASFTSLEDLLNLCMHAPRQDGLRAAEHQLKHTLLLKTMLELLPMLRSSLKDSKSQYFCQVKENLKDPRYKIILEKILETVFENAKTVKGSVAAHLHGCFAIKAGVNSLLDIAKKTYCEIVQEISDYVAQLKEHHDMSLRLAFSSNKGFHIQYNLPSGQKTLKENSLPEEFILVQKSKSKLSFHTTELVALDQRSQHVLNEIKLMTNVILFQLLTDIRDHVACLFNLCEDIAELDVLVSFAHVGSGSNFVRPRFGDRLDLKDSRHPILDVIHDGEVIPNDAFAKTGKNFVILTGPNQSGKSIYIRQIALLQIMAQIGCFVPAKEASFRLTDRIFSRIGFDDSIESNACTLIVEMRDMEHLKRNITPRSLVIIDELCRGTSVDEGTSLAFAICEELLDSSAFIFFTTHYLFLTKLEEMYFNVTNHHFESTIEKTPTGKSLLRLTHAKKPGVTKADLYGLQVALTTAFPEDVYVTAQEISVRLSKDRKASRTVDGLLLQYELSLQMRSELAKFEPHTDWHNMKSVICRYNRLYLNLIKEEARSSECTEDKNSSLAGGRSGQENQQILQGNDQRTATLGEGPDDSTSNNSGKSETLAQELQKPLVLCALAKGITRKYKILSRRRQERSRKMEELKN